MLEKNSRLGAGGTGFHGTGPNTAERMIRELQLKQKVVLAGAADATDIAVPGLLPGDTILSCMHYTAGVPTAELRAEVQITDNETIQLTTTDTTGDVLVLEFAPKPDRKAEVAGDDVNTDMAIPGIRVGDTINDAYYVAVADKIGKRKVSVTSEISITSDGNVQCTDTDLTGETLVVEWSPASVTGDES